MSLRALRAGFGLFIAAAVVGAAMAQTPVGTQVTYQGVLNQNGEPANGLYDLRFRLMDAATGGAQVGSMLGLDNVTVTDGLLSATVDFGQHTVGQDARWLEIAVRPAGMGPFTFLAPRQPLTTTPFAIQSLNDANWSKSGSNINNTNTGFVGINEPSPLSFLHVKGSGNLNFLDSADLATDQVVIEGGQAWLGLYSDEVGAPASGISLAEINSTTGALSKWSLVQRTSGNGNDFSITYGSNPAGNANPRFFQVKSDGNIGIGVDNPAARLHVKAVGDQDNVPPTSFRAVSEYPLQAGGTSTEYIQFDGTHIFARKDNGDTRLELQQSGGNVTIGPMTIALDDPPLVVSRNAGLISNSSLTFEDLMIHDTGNAWLGLYSDSAGSVGSGITFAEYGVTQWKWGMYARTSDNVGDFVITFGNDTNPTANEKMLQIDRDGTTKVKVLEILGADVSERFPTTCAVQPGDVVMIDSDNPGQLCLASGEYNTRVAGIVSGAGDIPVGAILGNMKGYEDAPPIALSGRVWTRCDATTEAIQPGDLLTTSATPGHAMKASDTTRRSGSVIGKAMTSLAKGESGLVLVLVNLQ